MVSDIPLCALLLLVFQTGDSAYLQESYVHLFVLLLRKKKDKDSRHRIFYDVVSTNVSKRPGASTIGRVWIIDRRLLPCSSSRTHLTSAPTTAAASD